MTFVCGTDDDFDVNPNGTQDQIGPIVSVTGLNTTTVITRAQVMLFDARTRVTRLLLILPCRLLICHWRFKRYYYGRELMADQHRYERRGRTPRSR